MTLQCHGPFGPVSVSSDPPNKYANVLSQLKKRQEQAYHLGSVVFVAVSLHIPYDLVAKQLRYSGRIKYKMADISCVGVEVDVSNR